jgi:isopenicillin N synthase-like dioxygenase
MSVTAQLRTYVAFKYNSIMTPTLTRNAQTDYGTLTLLFNDEQGGLQVKNTEGVWVDAEPIPGCCIVNVGDMLARWFNDKLKSTEHRVVNPTARDSNISGEMLAPRYSIAWFGQPNKDTVVEPLEPCCTPENPRKYPAVEAGKHVMERLANLQKNGKNVPAWTDDMSRAPKAAAIMAK